MKLSFLNQNKPLITCMIRDNTPNKCIGSIKNAIYDGADAFGLHLSCLEKQYHNEENYKLIFSKMGQRPVYLTNYRSGIFSEEHDRINLNELLDALKAGGTICDVMADSFKPSPMEITYDTEAIKKQMAYIDEVHAIGKEVLMSSHVLKFLPTEKVLDIAFEHKKRGADISKIVVWSDNEDEEMQNIITTHELKKQLDIPFLFLSCGSHYKIHRIITPMLGGCMALCVQQHTESSAKYKPVLRAVKALYDNADYRPDIII